MVSVIRLEAGIMRVGNSNVLLLPKPLEGSFEIEVGTKVTLLVMEDGIFVRLKSRVTDKDNEALKRLAKYK